MRTCLLVGLLAVAGVSGCGDAPVVGQKVDPQVVKQEDDRVNQEETQSYAKPAKGKK